MRTKQIRAFILALMTVFLVVIIPVSTQKKYLSLTDPTDSYQARAADNFESKRKFTAGDLLCDAPSLTQSSPAVDGQQTQAIYGAGRYLSCAVARATGAINPSKPTNFRTEPQLIRTVKPIAVATTVSQPGQQQPASPPTNLINLEIAEVLADDTIARVGPNSDHGRVTPLLKGIKATVIGRQNGDNNGKPATFVQMDYGAWVNAEDLKISTGLAAVPQSIVGKVSSRPNNGNTEVLFPLQIRVPLVLEQTDRTLKLTLYNTYAAPGQDLVQLGNNPIVDRVAWKSIAPSQVEYVFTFKARQQWGYKYRYDGNTLVLSLRHPPQIARTGSKPLNGAKILLDPGHGGSDSGAVGANGLQEKEVALFATKLLANELVAKGAKVYLTRETDKTVELHERRAMVEQLEPTISLSVHYNSLPEGGDPSRVKGFSVFWYHAQAQELSNFLHSYVTQFGNRPQHGVIWDNLALARPNAAPAVLLELGFMSNPEELQWINNPQAQEQMVKTIANGVTQWLTNVN